MEEVGEAKDIWSSQRKQKVEWNFFISFSLFKCFVQGSGLNFQGGNLLAEWCVSTVQHLKCYTSGKGRAKNPLKAPDLSQSELVR